MSRRAIFWLCAPMLLMFIALSWNAGIRRSQPKPTTLYPVLRHGDVIYIGGTEVGPIDLPEGRVVGGEPDVPFDEADLGAQVGIVSPGARHGADGSLFMDHDARHVPPGTVLLAVKRLDPANRLVGRTPHGLFSFVRHPVSNARTFGDVLLSAWKSVTYGTLQVRSVSLVSLSEPHKRVVVDVGRDVDALVIPILAAPVDWHLAPGGEAYDLAIEPLKGAIIHTTYFPVVGLLAVQLDLAEWGIVGIPVYAPPELRTRLDRLVREAERAAR